MARDEGWILLAVNAAGRIVIGSLETILMVISLCFMAIGISVFLMGLSRIVGVLLITGAVVTLGSMFVLLGWGFSRRLSIMHRQIRQMRADLDELLRRVQP
jgi:hypothetical protein